MAALDAQRLLLRLAGVSVRFITIVDVRVEWMMPFLRQKHTHINTVDISCPREKGEKGGGGAGARIGIPKNAAQTISPRQIDDRRE